MRATIVLLMALGCRPEPLDLPLWLEAELVLGGELCDPGDEVRGEFGEGDPYGDRIRNQSNDVVTVKIRGPKEPGTFDAPVWADATFVVADATGQERLVDEVTLAPNDDVEVRAAGLVECDDWGKFPDGRFDRAVVLTASTAYLDAQEELLDVEVHVE